MVGCYVVSVEVDRDVAGDRNGAVTVGERDISVEPDRRFGALDGTDQLLVCVDLVVIGCIGFRGYRGKAHYGRHGQDD